MPPRPTTVLLIRHAHTNAIGRWLSGRTPGVPLSEEGRMQADRLGRALSPCSIAAVYTSPLERAAETASAVARYQTDPPVSVDEALQEFDFGLWTGKRFDELQSDPGWRVFNRSRAGATSPGGERMDDVQNRIVDAIERLATKHATKTIALVSHADVLRAAVLHYRGLSLDLYDRIDISPASVTVLRLRSSGPALLAVNAQLWLH